MLSLLPRNTASCIVRTFTEVQDYLHPRYPKVKESLFMSRSMARCLQPPSGDEAIATYSPIPLLSKLSYFASLAKF